MAMGDLDGGHTAPFSEHGNDTGVELLRSTPQGESGTPWW